MKLRGYAIVSVTTQFTSYAQNAHHLPKRIFLTFFPNNEEFLVQILPAYYTFLFMLDYKFLFNYTCYFDEVMPY